MQTTQLCPPSIKELIVRAQQRIEPVTAHALPAGALAQGAETAEILGALTHDPDLAQAVLVKPVIGPAGLTPELLTQLAGESAAQTALALLKVEELWLPRDWPAGSDVEPRQAEALRKMLLAIASDPRLVLARLAEQLVALRHARELPRATQERLALEARTLLAPLASRLGIGQLKWELEDLAFRYLEPEAYRALASQLAERRTDRERYIEEVCERLATHLRRVGIEAEVYGRPKHIYSIYRKMQRKQLAFEQLFDIRAVRVVVESVRDCYGALGVVHGLWRYIPGEFDDYIATPKENGYRSIHTAVVGPQGRALEVQIRTPEMHEHAELGVAAHWTYKEGGAGDALYQRKIEWVRRLLSPAGTSDAHRDALERMRKGLFEDRVYALTPRGEVVDLPTGATPLDFAYGVHTSLGHRCRGAKVNGRIVPLTHPLVNGSLVEIITGKEEAPKRDWLAPEQGYLVSSRARAKVRAWFRRQDSGDSRAVGRGLAERELARTGARSEQLGTLAEALQARDAEHLFELLGEGEITPTQLARATERLARAPATQPAVPARRPPPRAAHARQGSPVSIEGVADLPTTLARCCVPLRPQPVVGYMTPGRGVVVHRSDCPGLERMRAAKPERVFKVQWTQQDRADLSVTLSVRAHDRHGLVRDVSDVLAQERLSIEAMTTSTDKETQSAHVLVTVAVDDLEQLERVVRKLTQVPDVRRARRVR
jgi:GTP pyrophosphokinase